MDIWGIFFGWPLGNVWGNIVASVIWALPPAIYAFIKIRNHQKAHTEHLNSIEQKLLALHAIVNADKKAK